MTPLVKNVCFSYYARLFIKCQYYFHFLSIILLPFSIFLTFWRFHYHFSGKTGQILFVFSPFFPKKVRHIWPKTAKPSKNLANKSRAWYNHYISGFCNFIFPEIFRPFLTRQNPKIKILLRSDGFFLWTVRRLSLW